MTKTTPEKDLAEEWREIEAAREEYFRKQIAELREALKRATERREEEPC